MESKGPRFFFVAKIVFFLFLLVFHPANLAAIGSLVYGVIMK